MSDLHVPESSLFGLLKRSQQADISSAQPVTEIAAEAIAALEARSLVPRSRAAETATAGLETARARKLDRLVPGYSDFELASFWGH